MARSVAVRTRAAPAVGARSRPSLPPAAAPRRARPANRAYRDRTSIARPSMPGKKKTEPGTGTEHANGHSPSPAAPLPLPPQPQVAARKPAGAKLAPQPPPSQQVLVICRNKCASFPAGRRIAQTSIVFHISFRDIPPVLTCYSHAALSMTSLRVAAAPLPHPESGPAIGLD